MIERYYITLGAGTTAGGKVISSSHLDTIDGAGVALEGDRVACPACNTEGVIALDGPRLSERFDGRQVALGDDLCLCGCSPPPRLVASQDFACQVLTASWHAGQLAEAVQAAAGLNARGASAAQSERAPLILRDIDTQEPFRGQPYRLELADGVISGTLDQNGATRPLTAAERAAIVAWHVDGAHRSA